jgi:hypothetical protein
MEGHGNPAQYLIQARYIESLKEMTRGNNSKVVFMPVETSNLLSSVGALKEMFTETTERKGEADGAPRPPRPRQLPSSQ